MKAGKVLLWTFATIGVIGVALVITTIVVVATLPTDFPKESLSDADVRRQLEQQSLTPQRWLHSVEKSGRHMTSFQSGVDWAVLTVDGPALVKDLTSESAAKPTLQDAAQLNGRGQDAVRYLTRCLDGRDTPLLGAERWVFFNASYTGARLETATAMALLSDKQWALYVRC